MEKQQAKEFHPSITENPSLKSKDLYQIMLYQGSLLVLTAEEFKRAIHRGKSVLRNRLLKGRCCLGPDILTGRLLQKGEDLGRDCRWERP
jgi:hypothetical protein